MSTEKLIEFVNAHPILFNLAHPEYNDTAKKESIWTKIAEALNEEVDAVKKKWEDLKDSRREPLRSVENTSQENTKPHNDSNSMEVENEQADETKKTCLIPQIIFGRVQKNPQDSNEFRPPPPRVGRTSRIMKFNMVMNASNFRNLIPSETERQRLARYFNSDPTELLFMGYAKSIKTFSAERQAKAKSEIAKIMLRHELLNYREQRPHD